MKRQVLTPKGLYTVRGMIVVYYCLCREHYFHSDNTLSIDDRFKQKKKKIVIRLWWGWEIGTGGVYARVSSHLL